MSYKFTFNADNCCWKNVCGIKETPSCSEHCVRYMKMHYLLYHSLLPEYKWFPKPLYISENDPDYNAFITLTEIKNDISNFVKEGKSLYICSSTNGNGKSHWAQRILISYLSKIWNTTDFRPRALFIDTETLLQEMKNNSFTEPSEYFRFVDKHIKDVDLVVWDDFGSSVPTERELKVLFSYINTRELAHKSNIYTSNVFGENLKESIGKRLYSRVYKNSIVINFKGTDKRGEKFE